MKTNEFHETSLSRRRINQIKTNTMKINGLNESVAYCEAKGLAECFYAYAGNCTRESILEIGFNENSGYTYIALENGVTICSMLGGDIEFLVTDFETGEEIFFNRFQYEEAVTYQ